MQALDQLSSSELHQLTADVYTRLSQAVQSHLEAKQAYILAQYNLDTRIASALHTGEIYGKNEKERDGHAFELFPELFEAVELARQQLWQTETVFQLAKLDEAQLTIGIKVFDLALN